MNKKMKNALVGLIVLLLAACGQFETPSGPADAPALPVIENPTDIPEPVVTPGPVEIIPTEVVVEGADAGSNKYVGLTYWSLPENLSEGFWMQIQDKEPGYSLMLVSDGVEKMLWLEKIIDRDSNGNAYWLVLDVLELSNLEPGLTLVPDACLLNGIPDWEILVAHRNGVIRYAWRANTNMNKFEVISISGIKCDSDKAVSLE